MISLAMPFLTTSPVRHAWREPLYGAIYDWMSRWYLRISWAAALAAAFALVKGLSHGGDVKAVLRLFFPSWGIAILIVGMYAFVQRIVELQDDSLVIRQGRSGNRCSYSDISRVLSESVGHHPALVIYLKSGGKEIVFLSGDLSVVTIGRFLTDHGVEFADKA